MLVKHMALREAREWRGLTQERLEDLSGVAQTTISKIERGDVLNPSSATVEKLELALRLRRGTLTFGQAASEEKASSTAVPPATAADRRGTEPDRRTNVGRRLTNGHSGHDRRGTQPDRRQFPGRRVTNGVDR